MPTTKQTAVAAGAVVVGVGAGVGGCVASQPPTPTPVPGISVPANVPSGCSSDAGPSLSAWLNQLPANTTVNMAAGACYSIDTSLHIAHTSGLTIQGNGAALVQGVAQPAGQTNPIVHLTQDTGLTLNNVAVRGSFDGTNGGAGNEGDYGLMLEANHNISVNGMQMSAVQGDFLYLAATNNGDTDANATMNSQISIKGSTFTGAGYHGITLEAVNGLDVQGDTFTNMGVDAIDSEVDVATSTIDPATGQALDFAEDNVTISHNTFTSWADDFYASLQGQLPGVQEQHVHITDNTLDAGSPLFEIDGANPYLTTAPYDNTDLQITGNVNKQAAISTHGAGPPGTESVMQIKYVVGVTISNNTFPVTQGSQPAPFLSILQAFGLQKLTITNNDFGGAYSILQPGSSGNQAVLACGNKLGLVGVIDATCPAT